MSEVDKTAIEMVRDLQSNIRNTTIAMVGILLIAVLGAVFWGGVTTNKVTNNEKNRRIIRGDRMKKYAFAIASVFGRCH